MLAEPQLYALDGMSIFHLSRTWANKVAF